VVALACVLLSLAQRALSTQSRFWRRRVFGLEGRYIMVGAPAGAMSEEMTKDDIVAPVDVALKLMTWAVVSLAVGLAIMRI
ncbi:hypothetical protein LCGC14_3103850, partial [marine sediment metagenome]